MEYLFEPIKIRYPLTPFLEVLIHCIRNGMNCLHLHTLMQQELFFLLRGFYEKKDIATLFYPIIGKSIDFNIVLYKIVPYQTIIQRRLKV